MLMVKIATEKDIPALIEFTKLSSGKLHSLPTDAETAEQRINYCIQSINRKVKTPGDEYYFFVMEDVIAHKIVGCCAIKASVGNNEPYYLYRVSNLQQMSHEFNFCKTIQFLELNTDFNGASEVCSLYLMPEYRKNNSGRLLSYARLLFIRNFPERFADRVFADMRGVSNGKGHPPFWRHVIKHFMPMSFNEADTLMGNEQRQFVSDLMPKFPICIDLLPTAAREVIGVSHVSTQAARAMLERENFHYQKYVNILDAGPTLSVFKSDLKMMNTAQQFTVINIEKKMAKPLHYMIANNDIHFRVIHDHIEKEGRKITISPSAAKALQVDIGDKVICRKM